MSLENKHNVQRQVRFTLRAILPIYRGILHPECAPKIVTAICLPMQAERCGRLYSTWTPSKGLHWDSTSNRSKNGIAFPPRLATLKLRLGFLFYTCIFVAVEEYNYIFGQVTYCKVLQHCMFPFVLHLTKIEENVELDKNNKNKRQKQRRKKKLKKKVISKRLTVFILGLQYFRTSTWEGGTRREDDCVASRYFFLSFLLH